MPGRHDRGRRHPTAPTSISVASSGCRRPPAASSAAPSSRRADRARPRRRRSTSASTRSSSRTSAGDKPVVMKTWTEAQAICAGQGKRLCGDSEWTLACEGAKHLPYPYGQKRDAKACNIDKRLLEVDTRAILDPNRRDAEVQRLWQARRAERGADCTSPYGVVDMTGNVDEWVVNRECKPFKSGSKGGYWGPVRNRCRPMTTGHAESFRFTKRASAAAPTPGSGYFARRGCAREAVDEEIDDPARERGVFGAAARELSDGAEELVRAHVGSHRARRHGGVEQRLERRLELGREVATEGRVGGVAGVERRAKAALRHDEARVPPQPARERLRRVVLARERRRRRRARVDLATKHCGDEVRTLRKVPVNGRDPDARLRRDLAHRRVDARRREDRLRCLEQCVEAPLCVRADGFVGFRGGLHGTPPSCASRSTVTSGTPNRAILTGCVYLRALRSSDSSSLHVPRRTTPPHRRPRRRDCLTAARSRPRPARAAALPGRSRRRPRIRSLPR